MKALIISNRTSGWQEKINCFRLLMPFLTGIVIVAPRPVVEQCAARENDFVRFVDETEFIQPNKPEEYGLNGFEHASFNFILRTSIICSARGFELLGENFLVMDDDNIPLEKIPLDIFFANKTYTGYYYQRFSRILPEKFQLRSYDVSLQKTKKMLADKGIDNGFVFSSHMPQIINRTIFIQACEFFNADRYGYMICDWSMYFNYAIKHHPKRFCRQPAPVICWPMNRGMAATSLLAVKRLFENSYAENYVPGGLFHTLPRYATTDNNGKNKNQQKIAFFRQQYPCRNRFNALLHYLLLKFSHPILPEKLIKLFYVLWKEDRGLPRLPKRTAIYWKSIHSASYIHAMRSRRWIHHGETIQVVGLYDYPSGLGTSARYLAETIEKTGKQQVKRINVSGYFKYPGVLSSKEDKILSKKGGSVIFMLGPPQSRRILHAQNFAHIQHKKLINYIWFEANTLPADWAQSLTYFDEVWVNNSYIKKLLAPLCAELTIPIKIRPFIPEFPQPANINTIFTPDKVSILTVFNINSGWYRKNPLALIQAYAMLPKQAAQRAELIIKTNIDPNHRHCKKLKAYAKQYGFIVLNKRYSDQELSGLIQGCDIYASLHRAEGLALLPMQAMSYGKAVLATGWSGNMAYMTEQANILVDYTLKQNNQELKPFIPDMVISDKLIFSDKVEYAEPDIQHASALLEQLIMNTELRKTKGKAARMSYDSYIESINELWKEIAKCS